MKKKVLKLLLVAAAVLVSGCVRNPPRPVEPKYDLMTRETGRDEQVIDDVGISLKPIMLEKATTITSLYATYNYWNPGNPREKGVAKNIMVNLPVFEMKITNSSQHAISFQKTAVRLVDDAGNSYQMQMKQDVLDFVEQELSSTESRGWSVDRRAAISAARNLRMFDKNYESLPRLTEKRFLVFDLDNATDQRGYYQLFKNAKYLRVMLYNVPVSFDQAGAVSKVSNFDFVFDVVRR